MIRDITIGQYYKTESVIHRLDPRTKLAITFWYLITLFIANNAYAYGLALVMLIIYICLSMVPVMYILKGLKPVVYIILLSVFMNLISTPGEAIFSVWIFRISAAGVKSAIFIGLRLLFLIMGSSIMTYTTTPNQLTDGIEKAFKWMNKLKIPVHEIAMMMSIALRFIPILIEELDKIMKAQIARGAEFNKGSVFKRLKAMGPVIIPLFVSAIRRANELALAMDARCYRGGEGRTKLKPLIYDKRDVFAYVFITTYVAVICVLVF